MQGSKELCARGIHINLNRLGDIGLKPSPPVTGVYRCADCNELFTVQPYQGVKVISR